MKNSIDGCSVTVAAWFSVHLGACTDELRCAGGLLWCTDSPCRAHCVSHSVSPEHVWYVNKEVPHDWRNMLIMTSPWVCGMCESHKHAQECAPTPLDTDTHTRRQMKKFAGDKANNWQKRPHRRNPPSSRSFSEHFKDFSSVLPAQVLTFDPS